MLSQNNNKNKKINIYIYKCLFVLILNYSIIKRVRLSKIEIQ